MSKAWEKNIEDIVRSSDENLKILQNRQPPREKMSLEDLGYISPRKISQTSRSSLKKNPDIPFKVTEAPRSSSATRPSQRKQVSIVETTRMKSRSRSRSPQTKVYNQKDEESQVMERKIEFLLKKTKKIEENVIHTKSELNNFNKEYQETRGLTLHLSDILKMDKQSIGDLREQMNNLRHKLDLQIHKDSIRDSINQKTQSNIPIPPDVGMLSEQIFNRVHREFTTVVDSVVRSCINEKMNQISHQGDTLPLPPSSSNLYHDEGQGHSIEKSSHDRHTKQINVLKRQVEACNEKYKDLESTLALNQTTMQRNMAEIMNRQNVEVLSMIENLTKKFNDILNYAVTATRDEIYLKYDNTLKTLLNSNVENCNRIDVIDTKLNDIWNMYGKIDVSVTELKSIHQYTERNLQELDRDIAHLKDVLVSIEDHTSNQIDHLTHQLTQTQLNMERDEVRGEVDSGDKALHEHMNSVLLKVDHISEDCKNRLNEYDDKLKGISILLLEQKQDANRNLQRLAQAGKSVKSSLGELEKKVDVLLDVELAVQELKLSQSSQQSEIEKNHALLREDIQLLVQRVQSMTTTGSTIPNDVVHTCDLDVLRAEVASMLSDYIMKESRDPHYAHSVPALVHVPEVVRSVPMTPQPEMKRVGQETPPLGRASLKLASLPSPSSNAIATTKSSLSVANANTVSNSMSTSGGGGGVSDLLDMPFCIRAPHVTRKEEALAVVAYSSKNNVNDRIALHNGGGNQYGNYKHEYKHDDIESTSSSDTNNSNNSNNSSNDSNGSNGNRSGFQGGARGDTGNRGNAENNGDDGNDGDSFHSSGRDGHEVKDGDKKYVKVSKSGQVADDDQTNQLEIVNALHQEENSIENFDLQTLNDLHAKKMRHRQQFQNNVKDR